MRWEHPVGGISQIVTLIDKLWLWTKPSVGTKKKKIFIHSVKVSGVQCFESTDKQKLTLFFFILIWVLHKEQKSYRFRTVDNFVWPFLNQQHMAQHKEERKVKETIKRKERFYSRLDSATFFLQLQQTFAFKCLMSKTKQHYSFQLHKTKMINSPNKIHK